MSLEVTYTPEEAAAYLKVVTAYWLKKKARAGAIPHTRLGRKVVFTEEHLKAILALFAHGSTTAAVKASRQTGGSPKAKRQSTPQTPTGNVRELTARPERSRGCRQATA